MQDSGNILIDKRSMSEIWANCNEAEKDSIRTTLRNKFKKSKVTIWNWMNGHAAPTSIKDREIIAQIIRKKLNIYVTPETLFPGR